MDLLIPLVLLQAGALGLHLGSFFYEKKTQKKLAEKVVIDDD